MNNQIGLQGDLRSHRLSNIDLVRGLVIVIMALDHVRDFMMTSGVLDPMAQADVDLGLYFTRWITHFCAPVFIFLAGTSVGLMSDRKSQKEIGKFVFKRGLWIVFVELVITSTAWTFAPFGDSMAGGLTLVILTVLWAIGVGMIILSALQFLGKKACLSIALIIILGHNMLDNIWPNGSILSENDPLWIMIYSQGSVIFGQFYINTIYSIIPWVAVMLLGFGTTFIFQMDVIARDRYLIRTGTICVIAFVIIRASGFYGEPNDWEYQSQDLVATFYDFMNVSKYPASLLFLLATLGPMAIVCGYSNNLKGWIKDTLIMFGRVPFAFYVAHIYLIHVMSILLGFFQGFEVDQFLHFFVFYPEGYGIGLGGVYVGWVIALAILYPFCKWVSKVKQKRTDWWLSYL